VKKEGKKKPFKVFLLSQKLPVIYKHHQFILMEMVHTLPSFAVQYIFKFIALVVLDTWKIRPPATLWNCIPHSTSTLLEQWHLASALHSAFHFILRCMLQKVRMRFCIFNSKVKVKMSRNAMQAKRGEEYSSYSFLTSELDGGEWPTLRPGRTLPSGKRPSVPIG
jgi:hypothetical protein